MAPKNKFTREEIVGAALEVVRKKGIDALTAKALAEELGTSTQPVFTCFNTMDAAKQEVRAAAERVYDKYAAEGLAQDVPFLGFGRQYLRFAKEEPQLYRLLFLTKMEGGCDALQAMEHSCVTVSPSLQKIYRISAEEADFYFRNLWFVAHGMATLIVTGDFPYSDEKVEQILAGFSISMFKAVKEIPGFSSADYDKDAIFKALINK